MKLAFLYTFILLYFTSCLNNSSKLHVLMEDANGLEEGSKVSCKGVNVGTIDVIKIHNNNVVATIVLNDDFKATKGTTVQVSLDNIFGKRSLILLPGASTSFLANNDTIIAQSGKNISIVDNLLEKGNVDSLLHNINLDKFHLDSLKNKVDSLDIDGLLKKAEKILDFNKLLN